MIYSNCDTNALYAMESARLGGYMDENDKLVLFSAVNKIGKQEVQDIIEELL